MNILTKAKYVYRKKGRELDEMMFSDLYDNIGMRIYITDKLLFFETDVTKELQIIKRDIGALRKYFDENEICKRELIYSVKEFFDQFDLHHDLIVVRFSTLYSALETNFVPFYHLYLRNLWYWKFVLRGLKELGHDNIPEILKIGKKYDRLEDELRLVLPELGEAFCKIGKVFRHHDYYFGDFWFWKTLFETYQEYKKNQKKEQ